ncbi:MAG: hypothetical protein QOD83_2906 [Solirubrobacteraceae bacterium]|nr:hypothetical protein [Solirubrobacteraceae bacterium]
MIWKETALGLLYEDLLLEQDSRRQPDIHEFLPAQEALSRLPMDLLQGWEHRVHPQSGAVDLLVASDERDGMTTARRVAEMMDPDREFRSVALDDQKEPEPLVLEELVTEIDGTPAIGPGGRVRALRRTRGSLIEIVVRPRVYRSIPSSWRRPDAIVNSVAEAAADSPRARIRFAFGYHEASSYEEQRWLRPAFVFLLDQPRLHTGGRWRIALVEPATDTDELPPDAGLENVLGRCP